MALQYTVYSSVICVSGYVDIHHGSQPRSLATVQLFPPFSSTLTILRPLWLPAKTPIWLFHWQKVQPIGTIQWQQMANRDIKSTIQKQMHGYYIYINGEYRDDKCTILRHNQQLRSPEEPKPWELARRALLNPYQIYQNNILNLGEFTRLTNWILIELDRIAA